MRKNFKKALAFACAMSMLLPATAPMSALAADNEASGTGSGVIENDNSVLPNLSIVTLPTIDNTTYNFTIDVEGLLPDFSDKYDDSANVYFNSIKTDATLAAAAGNDLCLVTKTALSDDAVTALEGTLAAKTVATAATALANYYVWQPAYTTGDNGTITRTGAGKFTAITTDFFDLVYTDSDSNGELNDAETITSATLKEFGNSGAIDTIFDGKVYTVTYEVVDQAAEKVTALELVKTVDTDNKVTAVVTAGETTLATVPTGTTTGYTAVTDSNCGTALVYTPAVYEYTGTSVPAKVVNKSTFDIALTTSVTLSANHGIDFVAASDLTTSTKNSMNLAIQLGDGTVHSQDVETASNVTSATAYYVLTGTGNSQTTLYKGEATDTNAATGSQNYYRYVNPNLAGSSAEFSLTASAAYTTADAQAAWKTYTAELTKENATLVKPTITVVYKWESVALDTSDTDNKTYKSEAGSSYVITTAGSDFWCTSATVSDGSGTATPGFENSSYTYMAGTATDFILYPANGTISAVAYAATSGSTAPVAMASGTDYTISANKVTLPANAGVFCTTSTNRGNNNKGDITVYLYVTMDGTTYEVPVLIQAKTN